jgi:hypothetical protein
MTKHDFDNYMSNTPWDFYSFLEFIKNTRWADTFKFSCMPESVIVSRIIPFDGSTSSGVNLDDGEVGVILTTAFGNDPLTDKVNFTTTEFGAITMTAPSQQIIGTPFIGQMHTFSAVANVFMSIVVFKFF